MTMIADISAEVEMLIQRAYDRGYSDGVESAKAQILAAVSQTQTVATTSAPSVVTTYKPSAFDSRQHQKSPEESRKRAPRGLPKALINRVLSKSPHGATPQQIIDAAETEHEKMIAVSSIRSTLRKGQDEVYLEDNGVWYLVKEVEAEDRDLDVQPSASDYDNNNGGNPNAAAITDLTS